jgi:hypothetical protein
MPMKASNDTKWDRTYYLPISRKHVVLRNVVDSIILLIIIMIITVVFWRCIHSAH